MAQRITNIKMPNTLKLFIYHKCEFIYHQCDILSSLAEVVLKHFIFHEF